jgi:hypothetical protein
VICVELDIVEAPEAAVPDRYSALIVLGAGIGIRMYEALGLTLDRVDFLRRQVAIVVLGNFVVSKHVMRTRHSEIYPVQVNSDGESACRRDPVHPHARDGWPSI